MAKRRSKFNEPYPIGLFSGAQEFEDLYPSEMQKLGTLTAYWSLAEDALCGVFAALLKNHPKAEAAFYSTINHKARRDMVLAVSKRSRLSPEARKYFSAAIDATKKAADARNSLLHGLLKMELTTGELLAVSKRPVAKVPEFTKKNVGDEIVAATEKCTEAISLLRGASVRIKWPKYPDDFEASLKRGAAKSGPASSRGKPKKPPRHN